MFKPLFFFSVLTLPLMAIAELEPRYAFVTSAIGSANYSTWPEASPGTVGLAAADSICRNLATEAELPNPDDFIAWKSDSVDDLWCRIQGLSGRPLNQCNGGFRPGGPPAGPWLRMDGSPFAPDLSAVQTSPQNAFQPALFNELGEKLAGTVSGPSVTYRTGGTTTGGWGSVCDDWTTPSFQTSTQWGSGLANDRGWLNLVFGSCGGSKAILCAQTGAGPEILIEPPVGNLAFITDEFFAGNFTAHPDAGGMAGIDAADAICRSAADRASLPYADTFKAFLAEPGQAITDRFTHTGPWYRTDGNRFLTDFQTAADDGRAKAPLYFNEYGAASISSSAWANVSPTTLEGLAENCEDWSSSEWSADSSGRGQLGSSRYLTSSWTGSNLGGCNIPSPLFCLSDAHQDLTVGVVGSGVVVSEPEGIDCPSSSCQMTLPAGSSVILAAQAIAPGHSLQLWRGAPECGRASTCEVVLTEDRRVVPEFSAQGSRPPVNAR